MTTAYVAIPDVQIEQDKPVTESLLAALRDNPLAIAEGDSGAPRVKPVILHVVDQKTAGTTAGTQSGGSYIARTLNTVKTNTITGASVAANQITLPAGEYSIFASVPGYNCSNHKTLLYNVTDAADIIYGTSEQAGSSDATQSRSWLRGRFTLTGTKVLEIRQRIGTGNANALGNAANDGTVEIYTDVEITKIG